MSEDYLDLHGPQDIVLPTLRNCRDCIFCHRHSESEFGDNPYYLCHHKDRKGVDNLSSFPFKQTKCKKWTFAHTRGKLAVKMGERNARQA